MKKLILLSLLTIWASTTYSQRCDDYHLGVKCRPSPQEAKDMVISSQSRSAELEARKTYSFDMTFFRNMDYRVIFCADRKFYPIYYVITEKETGIVLFDNQEDNYVESIGFTSETTTIVTVELTLLAEDAKFDDFRENRACVGIPVLYRRVEKLGF